MDNDNLLKALGSVEKNALNSKFRRMLRHPPKYFFSIVYKYLIYPIRKKEILVTTNLFNGVKIKIALPASTDIFLTGGKSHISEIKLTKYLIKNLRSNSLFIDVGAHYGYFSLVASDILKDGKVYSFEPTSNSFSILKENMMSKANVIIFNKAVSNNNTPITFYEFDNLHSEYNSTQISQFENENWFKTIKPKVVTINTVTLSDFCQENSIYPDFIKIDVEGFENEVIKGAEKILSSSKKKPIVIIEYLTTQRGNKPHKQAYDLLSGMGYSSFTINQNGDLEPINNIDNYLISQKLESDNIVFIPVEL
jgi:FkbM family methyltransferase